MLIIAFYVFLMVYQTDCNDIILDGPEIEMETIYIDATSQINPFDLTPTLRKPLENILSAE